MLRSRSNAYRILVPERRRRIGTAEPGISPYPADKEPAPSSRRSGGTARYVRKNEHAGAVESIRAGERPVGRQRVRGRFWFPVAFSARHPEVVLGHRNHGGGWNVETPMGLRARCPVG